jgi:hypothetical protein
MRVTAYGRDYYYFQIGRGTKTAGPRIALPNNPHTVEFWQAYKAAAGSEAPSGRAFDDLIAAYRISPDFLRLAQATQIDYQRYLDMVSRAWGQLLVSGVRPKHVIALRDTFASAPVAANHLLAVLKTLINWGIPREFSDTNPCIAVPKLVIDEGGAHPWPVWAFDLIES